jgi:hypothetical protein
VGFFGLALYQILFPTEVELMASDIDRQIGK